MVRWLERNGYDVSYLTGVDVDRRGAALLKNHKVFMSVGPRRVLVGRPARQRRGGPRRRREPGVLQRQRGVLEDPAGRPSIDGIARPYRTLVCYKETQRNGQDRPRPGDVDRHLARPAVQPAGGRRPARERAHRHAVHGQRLPARRDHRAGAVRPRLRLWRNTSWRPAGRPDRDVPGRHARLRVGRGRRQRRPPGRPIDLSSTTVNDHRAVSAGLRQHVRHRHGDAQPDALPGRQRRARVRRRHRAVGLGPRRRPRPRHGRRPPTRGSSRPRSTCSPTWASSRRRCRPTWSRRPPRTDTTAPTVRPSPRPAAGATVAAGAPVTVTGTAADAGGGRRAASRSPPTAAPPGSRHRAGRLELHLDAARTGHGDASRRARSTTARTSAPSAAVRVTVGPQHARAPLFPATTAPTVVDPATAAPSSSASSSARRQRLRSPASGSTRRAANTGTHTGTSGRRPARCWRPATFTGETASGWQTLTSPRRCRCRRTPLRRLVLRPGRPLLGRHRLLHRPGAAARRCTRCRRRSAGGNGVYHTARRRVPDSQFNATNYWVDAVFDTPRGYDAADGHQHLPGRGATGVADRDRCDGPVQRGLDPTSLRFSLTAGGGAVPGTAAYG